MEFNERFRVVLLVTIFAFLMLACKGDKGDKGEPGEPGAPGVQGAAGRDGSPDTAAQVLDKLNQATADGGTADLHGTAISVTDILSAFPVPSAQFVRVPYSAVAYDRLSEFN